ncbi:MAG: haloacid dehalogenase [Sphingobacteriaceae bacterium]|jgi:HAD superfamily hydrolase (TIGR01450 family)|nr:haloacid dehalogenase [Sphingobacteriaceae bacterium]
MDIHDFKSVVKNYQAVFFDAFGVLKNYDGLVPGITNTFDYLKAEKKEFFIVTNDASRSPQQLAETYHNLGLHAINADHIISSGMLAKEFLDLKVHNGIVAYLGPANSAHYIESSGLHTMPISDVNSNNMENVSVLVFLDDEGFDWSSDLNKAINLLRKKPIPAIIANTDYAYPRTANEVAIAIGGIAKMIETIVGRDFIRFGKPDSQMFMFAYDIVRSRIPLAKKDILMVGDTLHTDILGGNKFGLDTVLVFSGNTLEHQAETRINSTGIVPTYICRDAVVG